MINGQSIQISKSCSPICTPFKSGLIILRTDTMRKTDFYIWVFLTWLNFFIKKAALIERNIIYEFWCKSTNPKSQSMINERLFCSRLWCSGQARFCFTCFCEQKIQKLRCSVHSIYYARISNWNVPCEN